MKAQFDKSDQPTEIGQNCECVRPRLPIVGQVAPNPEIFPFPGLKPLHLQTGGLPSRRAKLREEVHGACREIREAFTRATGRAAGDRLDWQDQLVILEAVYRAVWRWRREGWAHTVATMLRRMAPGRIWRKSGLSLVVLRSALPDLCPKRASKWSSALELAYHHEIKPEHLGAFFGKWGGIDGAAKEWVEIGCEDWE